MAENQKNLCAMLPAELHSRVRAEQEQAGLTLSAYMTQLLTNYYEGGKEKMEKGTRTMAFQMPEEMFQRLKNYLERPHRQKADPEGVRAEPDPADAGRGGAAGSGRWRSGGGGQLC